MDNNQLELAIAYDGMMKLTPQQKKQVIQINYLRLGINFFSIMSDAKRSYEKMNQEKLTK